MLVVITGLPATGKSSIATALAERLGAVVVSEDRPSERRRRRPRKHDLDLEHFGLVAHAEIQLALGGPSVVVDAVNATSELRGSWWLLADRWAMRCFVVYTVCSDTDLHRRRLGERARWVRRIDFEPPARDCLVLDSVRPTIENVELACEYFETPLR